MSASSHEAHSPSIRRNGLAVLITSLEVLEATSQFVSAVPFLGSIVSCALGLARTVEVRPGLTL